MKKRNIQPSKFSLDKQKRPTETNRGKILRGSLMLPVRESICLLMILLFFISTLSCTNWGDQRKYRKLRKNVIEHYKADSNPLKLKAAIFLLDNLKDRYAVQGERYEKYADTIKKYCQNPDTLHARLLSIKNGYYEDEIVKDIDVLTPDYLIENIDRSFAAWEKAGWKDQISFDNFCEYILLYRFNKEPLENWRSKITQDTLFKILGDTLATFNDLQEVTTYFSIEQSKMKKNFKVKWGANSAGIPNLSFSAINILTTGTCANLTQISMFGCRSIAIPIANDFTPKWANSKTGHDWGALITKSGSVPFILPVWDKLGRYKGEDVISKVYRHTFSENGESHVKQRGQCQFLPDFFNDSRLIDVTDLYLPTHDIMVPLIKGKGKFAYLSVFGDSWVPVGWGKVNKQTACFQKVGENAVYLPVLMTKLGLKAFNFPFRVVENGEIQFFKPETQNIQNLELTRKYPLKNGVQVSIDRMIHGKFQLANDENFKDSITVYEITKSPEAYYNEVLLNRKDAYRYVRYLGSEKSYCNVAEIEFYQGKDKTPLAGKIIGTPSKSGAFPMKNAFDGDVLSYFDTNISGEKWVGLDFGKPIKIEKIRFVPRNDKNYVVPGNLYELFYWDNEWKSLGQQTATGNSLVFEKVPSNCLFFLKCYTEGKEERIFTYENGQQVWW